MLVSGRVNQLIPLFLSHGPAASVSTPQDALNDLKCKSPKLDKAWETKVGDPTNLLGGSSHLVGGS